MEEQEIIEQRLAPPRRGNTHSFRERAKSLFGSCCGQGSGHIVVGFEDVEQMPNPVVAAEQRQAERRRSSSVTRSWLRFLYARKAIRYAQRQSPLVLRIDARLQLRDDQSSIQVTFRDQSIQFSSNKQLLDAFVRRIRQHCITKLVDVDIRDEYICCRHCNQQTTDQDAV